MHLLAAFTAIVLLGAGLQISRTRRQRHARVKTATTGICVLAEDPHDRLKIEQWAVHHLRNAEVEPRILPEATGRIFRENGILNLPLRKNLQRRLLGAETVDIAVILEVRRKEELGAEALWLWVAFYRRDGALVWFFLPGYTWENGGLRPYVPDSPLLEEGYLAGLTQKMIRSRALFSASGTT